MISDEAKSASQGKFLWAAALLAAVSAALIVAGLVTLPAHYPRNAPEPTQNVVPGVKG